MAGSGPVSPDCFLFPSEALIKVIQQCRAVRLTLVCETSLTDKEQSIQASFHWWRTQFCLISCTGEQAAAVFVFDISPPTAERFLVGTDRVCKCAQCWAIFLKITSLPPWITFNHETFQSCDSLPSLQILQKKKKSRNIFHFNACVCLLMCTAVVV